MKPRVCFGMTLHNNAKYLPEAMESLLNQTYEDFHLVAVDDCSDDGTEEIMREYEKKDKRISYFRNESWSGMIATWRKAFFKAYELYQPCYFAWASDHDVWHRDWLKHHVNTLNKYTNVVLAYPETVPFSPADVPLNLPESPPFETIKMSKLDRMYHLCRTMREAGDKIYGLFRTEPLMKAGVFRSVSMPDRLLLVEIGIYGPFKYIPEKLWHRRHTKPMHSGEDFIERQIGYLFGPEPIPFHARFPYISHSLSLALSLSSPPQHSGSSDFRTGLLMALMYWEANREKTIANELKYFISTFKKESDEKAAGAQSEFMHFQELGVLFNSLCNDDSPMLANSINLLAKGILALHYLNSSILKKEFKNQETETLYKKNEKLMLEVEFWKNKANESKLTADALNKETEKLMSEVEFWKNKANESKLTADALNKETEKLMSESHSLREEADMLIEKNKKLMSEIEVLKNKTFSGVLNKIKRKILRK